VDILKLLSGTSGTLTMVTGAGILIALLFRSLLVERKAHTETAARLKDEMKERADAWRTELARINADHDQEIKEMRAKITRLETRDLELNARLDAEIALRREAQRGLA
jgi:hypothetical protein